MSLRFKIIVTGIWLGSVPKVLSNLVSTGLGAVYLSPFVSPDWLDFASCPGMSLEELYKELAYFKEYFGSIGILLEANVAERVGFEPTWEQSPPI